MVSEYGIPDPADRTQLPVHCNPYIELVIHPVATNFRNCHTRAAWSRKSTPMKPYAGYQFTPVRDDPGLAANLGLDNRILESLLTLDFQWAMSDRAIPAGLPHRALSGASPRRLTWLAVPSCAAAAGLAGCTKALD